MRAYKMMNPWVSLDEWAHKHVCKMGWVSRHVLESNLTTVFAADFDSSLGGVVYRTVSVFLVCVCTFDACFRVRIGGCLPFAQQLT